MSRLNPNFGYNFDFVESLKSQRFVFEGSTPRLVREYICDWTTRFAFCQALLGRAEIQAANTVAPYIKRYDPHSAAGFESTNTGKEILFATEIESMEGCGPNGESVTGTPLNQRVDDVSLFKKARVRVVYEAPTFNIQAARVEDVNSLETNAENWGTGGLVPRGLADNKRYVTKIIQPTMEVIRLPYGFFKWANGLEKNGRSVAHIGNSNTTGSFVIRPTIEITYVWHRVPSLQTKSNWNRASNGDTNSEQIGALHTHVGSINNAQFDGYPAGTLLCKAIEARPYRWIDGIRYYDYTYRVACFWGSNSNLPEGSVVTGPNEVIGHNHFLRQQHTAAVERESEANNGQGIIERTAALTVEPFYSLLTHNGQQTGIRPFKERNFDYLFTPYCFEHLTEYYEFSNVEG
jgi:hypothetical protein